MNIRRTYPAVALALALAASLDAQVSAIALSGTAISMNGRVHANRKFWENLKRQQAERARQRPPAAKMERQTGYPAQPAKPNSEEMRELQDPNRIIQE